MLHCDKIEVSGWEAAIRGMRNPMNSWDKSDSGFMQMRPNPKYPVRFNVGTNDLKLMKQLVQAGTDHSKFMRMIHISMDIVAPMYWWKEMDTYRVGVCPNPTDIEYNSTSTMHKIHSKPFELNDFSCDHIFGCGEVHYDHAKEMFPVDECDGQEVMWNGKDVLDVVIQALNFYRDRYLQTQDKRYWWQMIQLLPSSYNYLRTVDFNYQVARHIYQSRKNHKLDEWQWLCWDLAELPYARELIVE